jgi:hypothetical protein
LPIKTANDISPALALAHDQHVSTIIVAADPRRARTIARLSKGAADARDQSEDRPRNWHQSTPTLLALADEVIELSGDFHLWQIVLQKSFWGVGHNFSEP